MAINRRGDRWLVRLDGATLGSFATRRAAERVEADALRAAQAPHVSETVGSFAARWMDDFPRPRSSTRRFLTTMSALFVERFADLDMRTVTPGIARRFTGTHPASARALHAMFSDAARAGRVDFNPFEGLASERSRGREKVTRLGAADVDDLAALAVEVWDDYGETVYAPLILTAAYTGLAPAELYALRWSDIDFRRAEIGVALISDGATGEVLAAPAPRVVVASTRALTALGSVPKGPCAVFTTQRGAAFRSRTASYYWRPVVKRSRHPALDFYELRHFCGFLLATAGLSAPEIAMHLGHSDGGRRAAALYMEAASGAGGRERVRRALG